MLRSPRQTLLTGFEPFGSVRSNPTQRLVEHFARTGSEGHELTTCVLPVSYDRAPAMLFETIRRGGRDGAPFDLIWMLGVAVKETRWRCEKFGRNRNGHAADNEGSKRSGICIGEAPKLLTSTVPVLAVRQSLSKAGIPARVSLSAGGFLCNFVLFQALWFASQSGLAANIGFLHVPADTDTLEPKSDTVPTFPFDLHVTAVATTLAMLVNDHADAR